MPKVKKKKVTINGNKKRGKGKINDTINRLTTIKGKPIKKKPC